MTEQELRALVRDAIAKAGVGTRASGGAEVPPYGAPVAPPYGVPDRTAGHSSHALFTLSPGDPDGRCMIEPGVACNHCGYCKSYGH
jgi:hypothetical protein